MRCESRLEDVSCSASICECVNRLSKNMPNIAFYPELLKAWLTLRFNPSPKCFVVDRGLKNNMVRKLSADEYAVDTAKESLDRSDTELRTVLFDIVRSSVEKVPRGEKLGVLSSGGIDSTAVMGILCKLGYLPEAYSIGFGTENDEIESARMAADFLGVPHHVRVLDRILSSTVDANRVLDEPYRAACFYYDALKFVKESGVKYVFDGLGVDEFFGGYSFRYERAMRLANDGMNRVDAYVLGAHPNDYVPSESDLFGEKLRRLKVDWAALLPYFDNHLAILDQIFLADYNAKCRQNFIPLARLADPLRIQVFYPWVDDRFIDFSLRIPPEWKFNPATGETKILFRRAVRDLVPSSTMEKRKQGFGPTAARVYEELAPEAQDIVLDGMMISNGFVSRDYYRKILEKDNPSVVEINKLWDLYTLEVFLRNQPR